MKNITFALALLLLILLYPYSYADKEETEIFAEIWEYKLFCNNNKWGILDKENTVFIPARYDFIVPSRIRAAFLTYENGKMGIILPYNESLNIVPTLYDSVQESPWTENWDIQNNKLYGLINHVGKEVIAPVSEEPIRMLYKNKFILKKNELFYLADTNGVIYNQTGWEYAGLFHDDRAAVCQDGQWGYIDSNGNVQIDLIWEEAFAFSNGIAWVKNSEQTYFAINPAGKILFQTDYYPASSFNSQGTAIVLDTVTEKYGLMDSSGNIISDGCLWETEDAEFDSNGHWAVSLDGEHWGLVDETGKIVLPFLCVAEYRFMCQFMQGFAVINIDGKDTDALFQVYNLSGENICSFQSSDGSIVSHFEDGLMLISINERERAFINPFGEILIGPREGLVSNFRNKRAIFYENGKYGYIDLRGEIVIPAIYEEVSDFKNGISKVRIQSRYYYINLDGAIVSQIP